MAICEIRFAGNLSTSRPYLNGDALRMKLFMPTELWLSLRAPRQARSYPVLNARCVRIPVGETPCMILIHWGRSVDVNPHLSESTRRPSAGEGSPNRRVFGLLVRLG